MVKREIVSSEQTLVKEPYELPKNWVSTRLKAVSRFEYGKALPEKNRTGIGYPVYGSNGVIGNHDSALVEGPCIIIGRKGSFGEVNWSDVSCWPIDTTYYVKPKIKVSYKFLFYLLQTLGLKQLNRSSAIPGLNREDAYSLEIHLPPLPEQQRIVGLIESLFEKLDRAKELVQNSLDSFGNRKSAILSMAIQGQLTNQWRLNNSDLKKAVEELEVIKKEKKFKSDINDTNEFEIPHTWCWTKLGNLIELLTDYHANGSYEVLKENVELHDTPDFSCMIRTTNFEKNNFDSLMKYISKHAYEFLSKSQLFGDEILINKIGNAGSVYLMPKLNRPSSLAMNLFMLRLSDGVSPKYIYYHLLSLFSINDISQFVRGVTTKSIDKKSINSIKIAFPPLKEQKEIVRLLEYLIENEQKAKELYDVIENINRMKKSILARAFRGELSTNNPDEESASELLRGHEGTA